MAANNSDALKAEYERRIGRRSPMAHSVNKGPSKAAKERQDPKNIKKSAPRVSRQRISTGQQNLPTDLKKAYKLQFGAQSTGGAQSAATSFQRTLNNIVDDTIRELNEKAATERAINLAMDKPATVSKKEEDSPGLFQKGINLLENTVPAVGMLTRGSATTGTPTGQFIDNVQRQNESGDDAPFWQGLMEDFSRSPVGRGLDVISRPVYGVNNALKTAIDEDYRLREEGNQQNNPLRFLDDLAEGFGAGISGQEKTGSGDVWRSMRDNSDIAGFDAMRNLEESHPDLMKWVDRGVGLAGEIVFDPTTYVSGGSVGIVRNSGQQLTETSAKQALAEVADTAARDFFDDVVTPTLKGKPKYRPTQDAIAARAVQAAEDSVEKSLLEISAGTHAGWGKMGGELHAKSVANRVTDSVRGEVFKKFDEVSNEMAQIVADGKAIPMASLWKIRQTATRLPEFDDFLDNLETTLAGKGRTYPTREAMLASLKQSDAKLITNLANQTRNALDAPLFQSVYDEVYRASRDLYYNTVGLKVRGKTIPVKTIGKAYAYGKKALPEKVKSTGNDFAELMSYERNIPGRLSLVTQAGRSVGTDAFEKFRDQWASIARNVTDEQDKLIYQFLDGRVKALPPELETIARQIRQELLFIQADEIAMGARSPASKVADDYVFIYNRGGNQGKRAEFKAKRKEAIQKHGNAQGWGFERAEAMGLKPVESAFESLLHRKLKSTRDLSRALFMKDLVENYGSVTKPLSDASLRNRGLIPVSPNNLPHYLREEIAKTGEKVYLPKEHVDLFKKFTDISSWNSQDSMAFVRQWSKMTSIIKYMSTVPRPGFHIRNMIGDFFMGMLDGVPTRTYKEVMDKWLQSTAGGGASFRISDKISKSFDELKALYDTHANSGFFETELPLGGDAPTAGQAVRNARKTTANTFRKASDMREDYGRFVHFVAALRQETAALSKKGINDLVRLEEKALEAAVWRVNHYKFDYGALTAFERKIKLVFPFYTFTRKAAPTLLQQMFLNPRYLALQNRFMTYNDGSAADKFNHYYLPDYVKDMGYATLTNEEEPLYMTNDISPLSVLNSLDTTNSQQFAQSLTSQMNPLAQMPFEIAQGRQVFSGQATGSFPEYMMNKFSIPGQLGRQVSPTANDNPWYLQLLNESWTGAGIPVRKLTEEQQDFGLRDMEDRFIQDPFSEINRSQDKIRVYQSNRQDGTSFRVENVATGEVLFETQNPSEAAAQAKRLAGK